MPAERTVAIYSDPGRTSMFVRRLLAEDSADYAADAGHDGGRSSRSAAGAPGPGQRTRWSGGASITHHQTLLPLRTDGTLDFDVVHRWARNDKVNITVIVTEIPRMAAWQPKNLELHFVDRLAVISLPALGPLMVRRSLRREMGRAIDALSYGTATELDRADTEPFPEGLVGRLSAGQGARVQNQDARETVFITSPRGFPGRTWATMGMVAANEPLRSMRNLTGFFSAAAATGAFGVFFSTIWEMATFLPSWRLAAVSAIAVAAVVAWLVLANRLWDRVGAVGKREASMYNLSTLLSLLVSVAMLYLLLFSAILAMGLMLIEPEFMEQIIGEEPSFRNYVDIAWFSASLGTVGGAIGSNFDKDAHLAGLTQGSRELKRYPRDEAQR